MQREQLRHQSFDEYNHPDIMKDSPSTGENKRRSLSIWVSLFLIILGIALLAPAVWRIPRPAERETISPTTPADLTAPAINTLANNRPTDGKVLPTTPAQTLANFPTVPLAIEQSPVPAQATLDLDRIFGTISPVHDYFAAAEELGHIELGERTLWPVDYRVGERVTFYTADGPREAELIYMDDLAAYWVEMGLSVDRSKVIASAERLSSDYYPKLNHQFGQEWRPGVDGDSRFTVLLILGESGTHELGYFTDENQYPQSLFSQSNEREMIYLNLGKMEPGSELYDGTLVHEVQHLIQWNLDANEDKWFNEGMSQIAESIAGLDTVDPLSYLEQTNIRIDQWSDFAPDIYAHYAGSYLYLLYLWEQAGNAALTELARHPANGLAAVRSVLAGHLPRHTLESFTADWATAIYLDGESDDRRYSFQRFKLPQPFFANRVRRLPFQVVSTIDQYAIDYIDLDFRGQATITFAGDTVASLLDESPDGGTFWYAPPASSGRTQLTAAVDLTGLTNAAFSFTAWYDLEPTYDFAYLSVSTDNGTTWRILEPVHAITGAYGPGWGGRSYDAITHDDGWVEETIDLSGYAGQSILMRFDVVTDFEEVGRGFAISDLAISPLIDQPVWQPDGFVETGSFLPQRWAVRLIQEGDDSEIIPLTLDELNRAKLPVDFGPEGGVLVIMPLTPFVHSTANYWLSIAHE